MALAMGGSLREVMQRCRTVILAGAQTAEPKHQVKIMTQLVYGCFRYRARRSESGIAASDPFDRRRAIYRGLACRLSSSLAETRDDRPDRATSVPAVARPAGARYTPTSVSCGDAYQTTSTVAPAAKIEMTIDADGGKDGESL